MEERYSIPSLTSQGLSGPTEASCESRVQHPMPGISGSFWN